MLKRWFKERKRKELTKKVILYLLQECNKREIKINRKKLIKLMFLIERYNPKTKKLEKKSLLGNEYLIYYY